MSEVKTELKIWGDEKKEEKKELYLKLVYGGGGVELIACDSKGYRERNGAILIIKQKGVFLYPAASSCLNQYGIPTDGEGKIKIF